MLQLMPSMEQAVNLLHHSRAEAFERMWEKFMKGRRVQSLQSGKSKRLPDTAEAKALYDNTRITSGVVYCLYGY
jgi:hypothetical protein